MANAYDRVLGGQSTAQAGLYDAGLRAYMLRGVGPESGKAKVLPALRSLIRFQRINLAAPPYPVPGGFDAIFCRNVLIYFDPPSRRAVIEQLLDHLAPGGYLFLGHAESIAGQSERMRSVMPAVYQLGPAAGSTRAA